MAHPLTVSGYVANDPKMITAKSGRELAVFSVGENKRYFDRDSQEWQDGKTTYYEVAVGQEGLRQNVAASLQKGQRVTVDGQYSAKPYLDREGAPQVGNQLWAKDVSASMMHEAQHRGEPAVDRGGPTTAGPGVESAAPAVDQSGPVAETAGGEWGAAPPPPPGPPQDYAAGLDR